MYGMQSTRKINLRNLLNKTRLGEEKKEKLDEVVHFGDPL